MKSEKRVAVIGAGIGGLTAAAVLAKQGYKVTVFEKNSSIGGRCSSFWLPEKPPRFQETEQTQYRFDCGASMVFMPGTITRLENLLGEKLDIDLIKCTPSSKIHFTEKKSTASDPTYLPASTVLLTSDLGELFAKNAANADKLKKGMYKFLPQGEMFLSTARDAALSHTFSNVFDIFVPNVLRKAFSLLRSNPAAMNPFSNLHGYMLDLFKDERLAQAFSLQSMFMGLNPLEAKSFYGFLVYDELSSGCFYPRHGFQTIPDSLEKIILANNGSIRLNTEVLKVFSIISSGKESPIVEYRDLHDRKTTEFDFVICNMDYCQAMKKIFTEEENKVEVTRVLDKMQYGCSTVSLHFALNHKFDSASHEIYIGEDFALAFKDIFTNRKPPKIPERLAFYMHNPTIADVSSAPTGCSCLTVLVPVGNSSSNKISKGDLSAIRSEVMRRIGLKESSIKYEYIETPQSWEKKFGLYRGCALGLGHDLTQLGPFRPTNEHPSKKWLFFTGASVQPGAGVPTTMFSGMNTANLVMAGDPGLFTSVKAKYAPTWFEFQKAKFFLTGLLSKVY